MAVCGRSGSGKTRLIRGVAREGRVEPTWTTAFALATEMTEAVREGRYERYRAGFTSNRRPLVLEHVEDLRGKPVTRGEVRRLLMERAANDCPTLLILTTGSQGDGEILEWLASWTEVRSLE